MSAGLSFSGGGGDSRLMIPFSPSSSFFFFLHASPRQPRSLEASMALLCTQRKLCLLVIFQLPHTPEWVSHGRCTGQKARPLPGSSQTSSTGDKVHVLPEA